MFALGIAAMFCLFCEPCRESSHWMEDVVFTKSCAALLATAMYGLYKNSKFHTGKFHINR